MRAHGAVGRMILGEQRGSLNDEFGVLAAVTHRLTLLLGSDALWGLGLYGWP
jgi:hypothetical protein